AGLLLLLPQVLHAQGDPVLSMSHWMFPQQALQVYILMCYQYPAGGLLDKPGKSRESYHTYYCLSVLSTTVVSTSISAMEPCCTTWSGCVIQATAQFLQKPVPGFEECEDEVNSDPDTN
ncbi:hypothetical protein A6R68_17747, partial [Neotoma lepida]